jgi:hypothetical protein
MFILIFTILVFLDTLKNQSYKGPEYFEGYCITHSCKTYAVVCYCCERANPSHSMTQRMVDVHFLTANAKSYQFTALPAD